jgi:hypothetical protein
LEQLARPHAGYREHWIRVWTHHLDRFDLFTRAVPKTHRTRVAGVLGAVIEDEICTVRWSVPETAPALKRWACEFIAWGTDHPGNQPAPPTPFPAAVLDLLLAYPGGELSYYHRCPGCQMRLPGTRNQCPAGPYIRERPLAPACPWCAATIPAALVMKWTSPSGSEATTETTPQILTRLAREEQALLARST